MPGGGRRSSQPSPWQRDWAQTLRATATNHLFERSPAIKLTAQITDFCLYNYTEHTPSGTGTHIPVSTLHSQPGDGLCPGDTLHLLVYSIYIPVQKDAYKISICVL